MASVQKRLRAHYQRLYIDAKRKVTPNPDRSVVEEDIRKQLAIMVRGSIDVDAMAEQKAVHIIETLTKQEGEDKDEPASLQLQLFGEKFGYEPTRLIKDSAGNIIEAELAPLSFVLAELRRSSENVQRATVWNTRKARIAEHFQRWVESQLGGGRSIRELTWGNCARETGILRGQP